MFTKSLLTAGNKKYSDLKNMRNTNYFRGSERFLQSDEADTVELVEIHENNSEAIKNNYTDS